MKLQHCSNKGLGVLPVLLAALLFIVPASLWSQTARVASGTPEGQTPTLTKLNIFAILSPSVETLVGSISSRLAAETSYESFPKQGYQIHCTLYMTQFPVSALSRLKDLVRETAAGLGPIPVKTSGLELTKGNWFFLNLQRTSELRSLADQIVLKAAPFRAPTGFIPDWVKEYPEKLGNIEKFGSPNVFDQFDPHLTLLAKGDPEIIGRFLAAQGDLASAAAACEGTVIGLGLGEADRDGQMRAPLLIERFPDTAPPR